MTIEVPVKIKLHTREERAAMLYMNIGMITNTSQCKLTIEITDE